jgi:hypothetical protein
MNGRGTSGYIRTVSAPRLATGEAGMTTARRRAVPLRSTTRPSPASTGMARGRTYTLFRASSLRASRSIARFRPRSDIP